ncbi:MAG: carbamate kinase, partial [Syntrophaceae bacterium]|nr:carbamate kinase [Syntrophaceae bacterium]
MTGKVSSESQSTKHIVIALGGNAILKAHQKGILEEQIENIRVTSKQILEMMAEGHKIIITHGNGPQVGNLLIQQEEAHSKVPAMPMDVCGAMSQGQIGYMLEQVLYNLLQADGINRDVLTVITQVMVDSDDHAFKNPTKPVGPFYDAETKERYEKEKGYIIKEVKPGNHRPFRRVVPSPNPLRILEAKALKRLVDAGIIIIASGGGGIPVAMDSEGDYHGVEAVIDKDLAGEKLAEAVIADLLLILTDVEKVFLDFGTPKQRALDLVRLE